MRRMLLAVLVVVAFARPALAADYHAIVRRFVDEQGFNGVALVGRGDKVVAVEAAGLADAAAARPMTADTRFEVGSISKWIASIVVLRLVDKGQLSLDAPISTYLPDYRPDTGKVLTLRRLMSHSSGVPNQVDAARKADPAVKGVELEQMEAVRRYASGDLAFAPGSAWDYSHSNWILVKAIAERVSGKVYAQLVRDEIVRPLGLKNSGVFHGISARSVEAAEGYAALTPVPQLKSSPMPDYMAMVGGYYTTAPDLLKLMDGVLGGRLLKPASRQALLMVLMPDQHYALGGRVRAPMIAGRAREAAWEDGSNGGFRVLARRVLADGHTVIVLTNASFDYQKLGDLGEALMEAGYP
ncbi:serine hydrolase [Caulobacter sp. UNC279MFTsu5.1]|uniref:serine hydrolase domain-containing protein n=1 Tax=Caulobacter sp. UNC279MFTsu5.1 TaxID=1502775 RepID=UPI0008DF0C63|nr:serine hydrolase domain-containing protein [Caulobacter sp. UNC279MFTsu5.1]SFJ02601.1 CubicO group peptidase, beta-lactamase class C family [Caulobacter sp. UNC279MFTsu5.1]